MTRQKITRKIAIPPGSPLTEKDYEQFLYEAYSLFCRHSLYFAPGEDVNAIELAHLIPETPETILAIYIGINDSVCNKALITPFLPRHEHNNVFVFEPSVYSGGEDVPAGTIDVRTMIHPFAPPNETWDPGWTYVAIKEPDCTYESLWNEKGYIDTISAKQEDFTIMTDSAKSKVCVFVAEKAFDHPVNSGRTYLKEARRRGEKTANQFTIPTGMKPHVEGLVPVVLERGEKLFIADPNFGPCPHSWCNMHPDNTEYAVVNENSAVPLQLANAKPPLKPEYAERLIPPHGSADMTIDCWYEPDRITRTPLLQGLVKG
ncbi:MAG: hypothetical protein ACYS0I_12325 [Planctomycetota bacterium]|jgi:hypothetical protein